MYMDIHQIKTGIKLSTDTFDTSENIWSVPLYMIEQLPRLIKSTD